MFSCYLFLGLSLLSAPRNFHVSACGTICPDQPVFTPSTLVVRHGDAGSATCAICPNCTGIKADLEVSVGSRDVNGTELTWSFRDMTEWDTSAMCFYTAADNTQCCSTLPVIVYQPPVVAIELMNHTGPMKEHSRYTLVCRIRDVAPVQNLIVTFYQGQEIIFVAERVSSPQKTPVTKVFHLNIHPTEELDGAQFYCRAALDFGDEAPPVTRDSGVLSATVHYGPHLEVPANPAPVTVTEGDALSLNCTAAANPPPSYTWTLPSNGRSSHNGSVLAVAVAAFEHGGRYVCSVGGNGRTAEVEFHVTVRANIIPYIIAGTIIAVALALCGFLVGYVHRYKRTHMGQYNLKDVFRLGAQHIPTPI